MAKAIKTSKVNAYWAKHPQYTALVHVAVGVGLGMLIYSFNAGVDFSVWSWSLLILGGLGHVYAFIN